MGLYEGIKDVARVVQKADNIELYKKCLDLASQAQDLQEENTRLKSEIKKLNELLIIKESIVRHTERFLTLADDKSNIKYCAHCWDADRILIQLDWWPDGSFLCPHCKNRGIYDGQKYNKIHPQLKYGVISKGPQV